MLYLSLAALLALAGRGITLGALAVAAAVGVFAPGERIMARVLLPTYALLELVFALYYGRARARNPVPAAVLESLWVGWFVAVIFPTNW